MTKINTSCFGSVRSSHKRLSNLLRRSHFYCCVFLMFSALHVSAQQTIPLYKEKIPNAIKTTNTEHGDAAFLFEISQPTLSVFLPAAGAGNGTAVLICPGGGYSGLSMRMEGFDVAKNLNKLGITAFVLKYRMPSDRHMIDKSIGPLQDAQHAIMLIRQDAASYNIDPARVGVIGFSAGGHLASTLGTHFNTSYTDNPKKVSLRPDFMILVYPVISFADSLVHAGSMENLIGKNPDKEMIKRFSNELQVTADTPPTFLIHAGDDSLVTVKNSIVFYLALQKNAVPAAIHIFPKGQHGFFAEPAHSNWFKYCENYLRENNWIK